MVSSKKKRQFEYRNEKGSTEDFNYGERISVLCEGNVIANSMYENINELNDRRFSFSSPHVNSDFYITDDEDVMNAWSFKVNSSVRKTLSEIDPFLNKKTVISDVTSYDDGRNYDNVTDSWFDVPTEKPSIDADDLADDSLTDDDLIEHDYLHKKLHSSKAETKEIEFEDELAF